MLRFVERQTVFVLEGSQSGGLQILTLNQTDILSGTLDFPLKKDTFFKCN